jgi:hypothetical protein
MGPQGKAIPAREWEERDAFFKHFYACARALFHELGMVRVPEAEKLAKNTTLLSPDVLCQAKLSKIGGHQYAVAVPKSLAETEVLRIDILADGYISAAASPTL